MHAVLTSQSVTHVYREVAGLDHMWPKDDEGKKVRDWMRARVRNPWPKEYYGQLFIGEAANNLVYRATLKPNGIGWTAERADPNRDQFDETPTHLTPEDETMLGIDPYDESVRHV